MRTFHDSVLLNYFPLDTGRKLNICKISRTSSERLMWVQVTSCLQGREWGNKKSLNCDIRISTLWFLTFFFFSRFYFLNSYSVHSIFHTIHTLSCSKYIHSNYATIKEAKVFIHLSIRNYLKQTGIVIQYMLEQNCNKQNQILDAILIEQDQFSWDDNYSINIKVVTFSMGY